ncbi:copper chaperone PCu(A)C [Rhizobiaceae bacterium]|nr:copper chaperone PCu(A)C [Rhizobiaceae bacterium]
MTTATRSLARAALATLLLTTPLLLQPTIATATDTGGHAMKSDAATGGSATVGELVIDAAWTRQTPPGAKVAGGYLTVTNNGTTADRLIGGSASFAERVEVHEMSVTDGVTRMAALADGLDIPAGETVALEPGSFHLMFTGLTSAPKAGETVPVTLTFANAGDVTVQLPVAAIGAPGATVMHGKMDHSDSGHDMKQAPSQ